jgi:hypothetical protein
MTKDVFMSLVLAVVALAALPLQSAGQAPQTDTTFAVAQGARLRMNNQGGDIVVRAWDRSQIRIQANHSRRTSVEIAQNGAVIDVRGRSSRGAAGNMVDYQVTVPSWMALELGGMYAYVDVEGVRGSVIAQTLEGDITVKGGADVKAHSTSGKISVEGARGRVEVNSTSEDVRVADVQGDVFVEALSGDIRLQGIRARIVEAETLSGDLIYDGTIVDGGRYSFLTHSGDISLSVADGTNAVISTAIGSGDVRASFALPTSERPGRRRQSFRMGSGSAAVEAETFSGDVRLYRPAELQARLQQADDRARERAAARARPKPEPDASYQDDSSLPLHRS